MRLFDDLANATFDSQKENRDYTNEQNNKTLQILLSTFQLALVLILAFFDTKRTVYLVFFLIGNTLLYKLLFNVSKFRYFLPLLKYPFIIYILNLETSYNLITIYSAFVIFEMLEDPSFPNYLLTHYKATMPDKKFLPYLFLLFFLFTQIILKYV